MTSLGLLMCSLKKFRKVTSDLQIVPMFISVTWVLQGARVISYKNLAWDPNSPFGLICSLST